MSLELQVRHTTGGTVYAIVREAATGKAWNGSAFVAWVDANVATYDIPLPSLGGDRYGVNMPSTIPAGNFWADYYLQAGASPAITDQPIKSEAGYWSSYGATAASPSSALTAGMVVTGVRRWLADETPTYATSDAFLWRWISDAQRRIIDLLPYDGLVSGAFAADQEIAANAETLTVGMERRRALEHYCMHSYYRSIDPTEDNIAAAERHEAAFYKELGLGK